MKAIQSVSTILLCLLHITVLKAQSLPVNIEANDCIDAIPICGNVSYSTTSQGSQGDDCDVTATNRGCIGGTSGTVDPYPSGSAEEIFCRYEYSPTWFYFNIQSGGTLEFLAGNSGYDLDFALYGPVMSEDLSTICTYVRSTPPIRCNFCSGAVGNATGIQGNGGNGPCPVKEANMTVNAGETYVLLLMQWVHPPSPIGFDLWFNGGTGSNSVTSTAIADCSILKVEFGEVNAVSKPEGVNLSWTTVMEDRTSHFEVMRAGEDHYFETIGVVSAKGQPAEYSFMDRNLPPGEYGYRLVEHDMTGNTMKSEIVTVRHAFELPERNLVRVTDIYGRVLDPENLPTGQVLIYQYDNGDSEKTVIME